MTEPEDLAEEALQVNVRIDTRKARLSNDAIQHFATMAQHRGPSMSERFEYADREWESRTGEDALCLGTPCSTHQEWTLSRIMNLDVFVRYHTTLPINDDSADKYLDLLLADTTAARSLQRGILKGLRKHFWLTRTATLDRHTTDADDIRDVLALDMPGNIRLLEIRFPPGYFSRLSVPTFVDGGGNLAFCCWSEETEGVGYTWRLDMQTRGLPELVGKDAILTDAAEPHFVGTTARPRPPIHMIRLLGREDTP